MSIVKNLCIIVIVLTFLWSRPEEVFAQCNKGLGVPVIQETFGSGTPVYAPPLPLGVTDYTYLASQCPDDGQYAIVNYTSGCFNVWPTLTDHTGNTGGYFMIVNAAAAPGTFYTRNITGLCPGTTYDFSAWMVNLGGGIPADVTFTIEKADGTVLGTYDTQQIPLTYPVQWTQYGFYFTTPNAITAVVLRMRNNAPGGGGNNFAIDDIAFAPAGPSVSISINGFTGNTVKIPCNNSTILSAVIGTCYVKNSYQWQISADGATWTDVPGANTSSFSLGSIAAGTYFYRLGVAQDGNIENVNCRAVSNTLKVTNARYLAPEYQMLTAAICLGNYTLPSGKRVNSGGIYKDTVLSSTGCDSLITTVYLTTAAKPNLGNNRSICAGDTTSLNPGTFVNYKWQDGSTTPSYKVLAGGTYSVTVTDSLGCMNSSTVVITEKNCSTILIPNVFTPNGDGINDTWNIPQLQYFPLCKVEIFSRWGQLVFNSIGYPKAWDGNYHGQPLPVGTYYYIINLMNSATLLSGSITLIR